MNARRCAKVGWQITFPSQHPAKQLLPGLTTSENRVKNGRWSSSGEVSPSHLIHKKKMNGEDDDPLEHAEVISQRKHIQGGGNGNYSPSIMLMYSGLWVCVLIHHLVAMLVAFFSPR